MAQRNRKPKRKLKCCPCLSSPGPDEDWPEQCLPSESDEEAKLLGHYENSDDNKENFSKINYQIEEKPRKLNKEWKAHLNSQHSQLCNDREDMIGLESHSLLKNASNISSTSAFKKYKQFKNKNLENDIKSSPEQNEPTKNDNGQNQAFSLSSLSLSIMEKKAKVKKASQKSNSQDQLPEKNFGKVCKSPKLSKKSKTKTRPFRQHLHDLPSQDSYLNDSDEEQIASISKNSKDGKPLYKRKGINSALCYFEDSILTGFKKCRKSHKGISIRKVQRAKTPETNRYHQSVLEPLLSSSPITLELKNYDSEEEFSTGSLSEKRDSLTVKSSTEEMCSSFDHSQDIFLTQRSLSSEHVSNSWNSSLSSPAPKRAKNGSSEWSDKPTHSPDNLSRLSSSGEIVPNGEIIPDDTNLSQNNLKFFEKIRKYSSTKEKAIQTEDFFGSSGLATSFLLRKEVDLYEKPLDLTLPGRSRSWVNSAENVSCAMLAAGDGVHLISENVSETICSVEDQTIGSGLATAVLSEDSEKCVCHQLRKSNEINYIQTKLNSSFFFKMKDEPDTNIPKESLAKLKNQIKK